MPFNELLKTIGQNLGIIPLVSPVPNQEGIAQAARNTFYNQQALKNSPTPTPTVTPTPVQGTNTWTPPEKPAYDPNFKFNIAPYMVNRDRWVARFGDTDPNAYIESKITPEQQQMIRQYFPNDATRSAIVRLTEDRFVDNPEDYTGNANGTVDSGAYMNNSGTFADMMSRPVMAKRIANRGITSFSQLKDNAELATRMAQLTADPNPYDDSGYRWGAYSPPVPDYKNAKGEWQSGRLGVNKKGPWFGPNDAGFDLSKQLY